MLLREPDGLLPIRGADHLIATVLQFLLVKQAHVFVILHEQDSGHRSPLLLLLSIPGTGGHPRLLGPRKS